MAWYNYAIYDYNSRDFGVSTKTEHKEFTQHDIQLFIAKQLNNVAYKEECRKVGKDFYYFLEPLDKNAEKVLIFKDGQFGHYYQVTDKDLENLNNNAKYEGRELVTKFEKLPDYKAPEQETLF